MDLNWLMCALLVSAVGTGLFVYGHRAVRWPPLITGVLFFIYPYFIANVLAMMIIAIILLAGLWLVSRLGW